MAGCLHSTLLLQHIRARLLWSCLLCDSCRGFIVIVIRLLHALNSCFVTLCDSFWVLPDAELVKLHRLGAFTPRLIFCVQFHDRASCSLPAKLRSQWQATFLETAGCAPVNV